MRRLRPALRDAPDDVRLFFETLARLAPVIEVDGNVLADFGPSELAAWWKKNQFE